MAAGDTARKAAGDIFRDLSCCFYPSTNGEFSSAMLDCSVCRKQLKQLGTIPPARNEFGQMDHVLFADACSVISLNGARKRRNPVLRVEME